ncbi:MAG: SufS family cysteine desulfurase [Thermoanaerobaculia bacterium]|nr:SufS family cysteine desulfurase [Thermoanaerobaculia bacterium]
MSEATLETRSRRAFDVRRVRADFPILGEWIRERPLAFLDSAASAQKPRVVLDAERECYESYYANVHRGVHHLSVRSTMAMEAARETAREFLGAPRVEEVIFVRGTTEAVNLVAATWGRANVGAGDEVLITELEHHSNIVPWQMLCEEKGAKLQVAPIDDRGEVIFEEYVGRLSERTRIVSVAHISNSLGTVNPVKEMVAKAHEVGAVVFVDGAQAAPHTPIDVQDLGCDFYGFSGHKAFGPSGIGILWGRTELLEAMPPYQTGGEMILTVTFDKTEFNVIPHKFEAGTPAIAAAIGLGAALRYLMDLDPEGWAAHEAALLADLTERLEARPGIRLIGTAPHKTALCSFVIAGVHAHDVGTILDEEGVAVRTGHHCAQPVMERFGIAASVRASLALYNDTSDIDALMRGLDRVDEVFG